MYKGSKEITCGNGATIIIKSSGQFIVYAMVKKKRELILGPYTTTARILKYKLPDDIEQVFVKCEKSTEWTIEWSWYNRSEVSDPKPVEIPVGYQKPESLVDQMRRMIKTEMSAAAEEVGYGSFEEEDDFELDEEILTNYEMSDMQETEEYEQELDPIPAEESEAPIVEDDEISRCAPEGRCSSA